MYELPLEDSFNFCNSCGISLGGLNPEVKNFYTKGQGLRSNQFFSVKLHPKFLKHRQKCFNCAYEKFGHFVCRPNTYGDYFDFLMDVDTLHLRKLKAVTLENLIRNHGEYDGKLRWEEYRKKQAETNTFEYKNKKYGISKEDFDSFNKSRAVTLDNLIKRHGKEKGEKKWLSYCKTQSMAGVKLEHFVKKYGYTKGVDKYKEVSQSKANTLANFISRYGKEEGELKFKEYLDKRSKLVFQSKKSQELFHEITRRMRLDNVYYSSHNQEFGIIDRTTKRYYFFDFCLPDTKKIIEFNGDYWHMNPDLYDNIDINRHTQQTAQDIWLQDEIKLGCVKQRGFDVFVVWESHFNKDKERVINECIDFIKR